MPLKVLFVNHTAEVSGSERSLLTLLAALPPSVKARVATPPGGLAEAVEELGIWVKTPSRVRIPPSPSLCRAR
jgi:hypothetical protein